MTLVVFHTAVLAYVESREDREAFARTLRELAPVWISNEAPGVSGNQCEGELASPPHHLLLSLDEAATRPRPSDDPVMNTRATLAPPYEPECSSCAPRFPSLCARHDEA